MSQAGVLAEGNGERTSRLWGSPRRRSSWGSSYPLTSYGGNVPRRDHLSPSSEFRPGKPDRSSSVAASWLKDRLGSVRLEILVRPNAVRAGVGGNHDGALVVRVAEPADRGRATGAALGALAESFGVPPRNVTLVQGPTSRRKLVDIAARGEGEELLRSRLQRLLQAED